MENVELKVTNCQLKQFLTGERSRPDMITCISCGSNTDNPESVLIYTHTDPSTLTATCLEDCDHKVVSADSTEAPEANVAFAG
jgi:hypothetical protein